MSRRDAEESALTRLPSAATLSQGERGHRRIFIRHHADQPLALAIGRIAGNGRRRFAFVAGAEGAGDISGPGCRLDELVGPPAPLAANDYPAAGKQVVAKLRHKNQNSEEPKNLDERTPNPCLV